MNDRFIRVLILSLSFVILVDVGLQGVNLYQRNFQNRQPQSWTPPKGTTIDLAKRHIEGSPTQGKILIDFSEYECPYCIQFATDTYKGIRESLITSGKLRYTFFDNPLPIHDNAVLLARAVICSTQQNAF